MAFNDWLIVHQDGCRAIHQLDCNSSRGQKRISQLYIKTLSETKQKKTNDEEKKKTGRTDIQTSQKTKYTKRMLRVRITIRIKGDSSSPSSFHFHFFIFHLVLLFTIFIFLFVFFKLQKQKKRMKIEKIDFILSFLNKKASFRIFKNKR